MDVTESMTFGQRLRYVRSRRRMTQRALAKLVGQPESAISHYECGRREPRLATLCGLCRALRCSADVLLGT